MTQRVIGRVVNVHRHKLDVLTLNSWPASIRRDPRRRLEKTQPTGRLLWAGAAIRLNRHRRQSLLTAKAARALSAAAKRCSPRNRRSHISLFLAGGFTVGPGLLFESGQDRFEECVLDDSTDSFDRASLRV